MILSFLSGGKDSVISTFLMLSMGFDVETVSFIPKNKDSYMLHSVNINLASLVSEAMGLKHHSFFVSGDKEREVEEMLEALSSIPELEGISSGAVRSEYQKQRIDYIGEELGVPSYSPLWRKEHVVLSFVKDMEVIYTKVSSYGLGKEVLGKPFFPPKLGSPVLEGGEGETLVLDAPWFNKRLCITSSRIEGKGLTYSLIIEGVKLCEK